MRRLRPFVFLSVFSKLLAANKNTNDISLHICCAKDKNTYLYLLITLVIFLWTNFK